MQFDCVDFKSEILHIHLDKLQSKAFSAGLIIEEPITVFLVVTKVGIDCYKLP